MVGGSGGSGEVWGWAAITSDHHRKYFPKDPPEASGSFCFRVPNMSSELIEREDDARPCQTGVQRVLNGNPGRQLASSMAAVKCVSVALDGS